MNQVLAWGLVLPIWRERWISHTTVTYIHVKSQVQKTLATEEKINGCGYGRRRVGCRVNTTLHHHVAGHPRRGHGGWGGYGRLRRCRDTPVYGGARHHQCDQWSSACCHTRPGSALSYSRTQTSVSCGRPCSVTVHGRGDGDGTQGDNT